MDLCPNSMQPDQNFTCRTFSILYVHIRHILYGNCGLIIEIVTIGFERMNYTVEEEERIVLPVEVQEGHLTEEVILMVNLTQTGMAINTIIIFYGT